MIEYRPFLNSDPPRLLHLWNTSQLGRGAALGASTDSFEYLVFAQPHFDRQGLILAMDGETAVGFVHAGFSPDASGWRPDGTQGVIATVVVRPDRRRQGIGRELVARAEGFLARRGTRQPVAGEAAPANPFYWGLYGGSEAVGWLSSDSAAEPFARAVGYAPARQFAVYRKDLTARPDPFDPRLLTIRRQAELRISESPLRPHPWWYTRQGRLEPVQFLLMTKERSSLLGSLTVWGMDLHSATWGARTAGICDLEVPPGEQRKGYAKALMIDTCRRLREELVTHVEIAVPLDNPAGLGLVEKLGFSRVDIGTVYRRAEPLSAG